MSSMIAVFVAKFAQITKANPAVASPMWLKAVQIAIGIAKLASKTKRMLYRFRANLTSEERSELTELMVRARDRERSLSREEQRRILVLVANGLGISWDGGDDGAPVAA